MNNGPSDLCMAVIVDAVNEYKFLIQKQMQMTLTKVETNDLYNVIAFFYSPKFDFFIQGLDVKGSEIMEKARKQAYIDLQNGVIYKYAYPRE